MNLLQRTLDKLIRKHGSYRAAAESIGTDCAYLFKISHGRKRPSKNFLAKVGLIEVVVYRRNV